MDLEFSKEHLREHRFTQLVAAVEGLETAIADGVVHNADFVKWKATINRAVEEAYDALNHLVRYQWDGDVLVMGAWNVPAALKHSIFWNHEARVRLLSAMLPLHELLQTAKPLIVKRERRSETAARRSDREHDLPSLRAFDRRGHRFHRRTRLSAARQFHADEIMRWRERRSVRSQPRPFDESDRAGSA